MIIAVDFDGVLVRDRFPKIGKADDIMVGLVKDLIAEGHEVILWTCRVGKPLEEAVEWSENQGIKFAAVNDNAPSNKKKYEKEYPQGTRKVYADIYIDDHSLGYDRVDTIYSMLAMNKEIQEACGFTQQLEEDEQ